MKKIKLQLPNTKIFEIKLPKEVWLDNIGKVGERPTNWLYDYFLAYEPQLFDYSGNEIKRSTILDIQL